MRSRLVLPFLLLVQPILLSGGVLPGGGTGARGRVRHDFGTGDLGDETFRDFENDRGGMVDAVTFVPGDYPTLREAVDDVLRQQRESVHGRRSVISLRPGSHLMPRQFREVSCPDGTWPYYQSHYPRYLNGKKTRALIPDDGAEPKISEDHPCQWLPMRDTRFVNITGPIQVLGSEDMTSRVCGAWRFRAPDAISGWLRELVCLNQEEGVVFVESASWKFDGCVFAACGRGALATDILILRGQSTIVASQCTIEALRPDEPSPEWARWPPGNPKDGVGVIPPDISPMPQGGYVGAGVDAGTRTRVMLDRCLLQGLLCAVVARDACDLSLDDTVLRWNQYGITLNDAAMVSARTCTFKDNVYGAFFLEDETSIEGTSLSIMASIIVGPQWATDIRPGLLDERALTVEESAADFLQPGAPGHHRFQELYQEDDWVPGKGEWDLPDWRHGNNTAEEDGYEPYRDVDGEGPELPSDGVGSLLKDLTSRRRNAPAAFQRGAGDIVGSTTGM